MNQKKQPNRIFLREDLALIIIMSCKTAKSRDLEKELGYNLHDVINTKEQTVLIDGFEDKSSILCVGL